MTNYDKELIAKIEKYFLDIKTKTSLISENNQSINKSLAKLEIIENDIEKMSFESETFSKNISKRTLMYNYLK